MEKSNPQQPPAVDLAGLPFFLTASPSVAAQKEAYGQNATARGGQNPWGNAAPGTGPAAYSHLRAAEKGHPGAQPANGMKPAQSADGTSPPIFDDERWAMVDELRALVSDRQAEALSGRIERMDSDSEEALGRAVIAEVVQEHVGSLVAAQGQNAVWDEETQESVRISLFDSMFRLGRLQPLIDDSTIENIHVIGHEEVYIQRSGSQHLEPAAPIVRSEFELITLLQQLSRTKGDAARDFSASNPSLHLDLPAGDLQVRLHATMPPLSDRATAVFRVHRHLDISLAKMVEMGTLSSAAAHFLQVAVRGGKSIVVAGVPGEGKTTMVRALADNINPYDQIVTVETERELHLEKLQSRVVSPIAYEYVPAGESGTGERTLSASLSDGLRDNARYLIVGEVRGDEIVPMVRAMQVGVGTLSTTHAFDPDDCVEALAGLGRNAYGEEYMARQLGRHLNFIVQMGFVRVGDQDVRRVTHISETRPSSDGTRGVTTRDIFHLDAHAGDTVAQFQALPEDPRTLRDLQRAGLSLGHLQEERA